MLTSLTFISGNPGKAEAVRRYVDFPVSYAKIDLAEIQSLDLPTVVQFKAEEAYKHLRSPVLVEDTSLRFSALGRLPGPLIKWFLTELGTAGLCRLLDGQQDRSAVAEVSFGLYDGQSLQTFDGSREGSVSAEPRGDNGYGWDPIFVPDGYRKTWGEMTLEEQEATPFRRPALESLEKYLRER